MKYQIKHCYYKYIDLTSDVETKPNKICDLDFWDENFFISGLCTIKKYVIGYAKKK